MANRAPNLDENVFSISDLKHEGSRRLPKATRDYYNEGAMDLITLNDNVSSYDKFKIRPRVLRNVANVDMSTSIFGQTISMPFGISPTAMQQLAHPDGEEATSRAAASMNLPMCLSSYSNTSLENVKREGNGNPYMMQMCIVKDRNVTLQLMKRAQAAGYKAMFISVDVPVLGRRLNEMKNNFQLPEDLVFPNILSSGGAEFSAKDEVREDGPQAYDDTLEWEEIIPWLKENAGGMEIWLKGVTSPSDVETAIKYGVDGVVISNHGGRQLDSMPSTIDALTECAPVARGRIQIAVDGGIRRGTDIFKALALGAQYCFIGRIAIWGLAYGGQAGVELALKILQHELQTAMALAGCRSIDEISRDHLSVLGQNNLLAKL
ncbi:hypothetical protein PMZ80_011227 [Knufia obscura]|uniref:Oxidase FUB9 n=2 Tax=Knufia TaxID=430999 RepID=A0AAN8F280_9EURO|nr:hypothetical protein PMZ80_011227 [Knufia obscura]KAK5949946.1 hypothetical protein OHC33_008907 [Knufia fluminis]